MKITRMDLDMAGSPTSLVTKIFAAEPSLPTQTPVEELARQLDIIDIKDLETDGYEGGLLTQQERTSGIILVNEKCNPARRRFTIAHELGHFLIPTHSPVQTDQFMCRREDMTAWDTKHQDRYARMEAEANQFAALLLMPPPRLRTCMKNFKDPSISDIFHVADHFAVSPEAAGRSYIEYNDEPVAMIITENNKVLRSYRQKEFPFITVRNGMTVPDASGLYRNVDTELEECDTFIWCDQPNFQLYEQVQKRGKYGMILLWAELPDESDEEEEKLSADKRWRC